MMIGSTWKAKSKSAPDPWPIPISRRRKWRACGQAENAGSYAVADRTQDFAERSFENEECKQALQAGDPRR